MPTEIWSGGKQEFFGSGTVGKTSDTKRILLVKRLRALIASKGAVSADRYGKIGDTKRVLKLKIDAVLDGI
ncbi:hypothetical protein KGP36_02900 [Patescibacteria group bacterium]|nr:hypothetical protein [Patescibacteria group bacterium]